MASPNPSSPSPRPYASPAKKSETTFTRSLKYEALDEEGRALVGSYAISIALGTAFLLFVHLTDIPERPAFFEDVPTTITYDDTPIPIAEPTPLPAVEQPGEVEETPAPGPTTRPPGRRDTPGTPRQGRPGSRTEQTSAGAIGDAFGTGSGSGTGGLTGDVSNVLRGTEIASGSGGTGGGLGGSGGGGAGGKTVLGYGQGGQGATTPGRGGFGGGEGTGGGGGGGGIGGVGAGGGVRAGTVRVRAPAVVEAPSVSGGGRDVSDLGTFVRQREAQLRFCYQEQGLKVNPNLAGTVTVAISIAGSGNVTGARVTNRTWSGPGSSAAESCMLSKIRSWNFPSAGESGAGTYSFPFNFTRSG
ncbi:MAG TPA: AgmX/PglI C-terminal domain-containing protein [Gemmatimonadaceae bacterium]